MVRTSTADRPELQEFGSIRDYLEAMLKWRRTDAQTKGEVFSIREAARAHPGCSPSLITLILRQKRELTRDRVQPLARILGLSRQETLQLDQWVAQKRSPRSPTKEFSTGSLRVKRSRPQNHLLTDWLNIYVKDAAGLKEFSPDPNRLATLLGEIAPVRRVHRSLQFLLREGFLRQTLDHRIVKNDALTTTTQDIPDPKIRKFHQQALKIAERAIGRVPAKKRRANALVMTLNHQSVEDLQALLSEFYERLMSFAEEHAGENERLYQVLINLTPIGDHHET